MFEKADADRNAHLLSGWNGRTNCDWDVAFSGSIKMYSFYHPFLDHEDDWLSEIVQWQTFFILFSALLLKLDATSEDNDQQDLLGGILIVICLIPLAIVMWLIATSSVEKIQTQLKERYSSMEGNGVELLTLSPQPRRRSSNHSQMVSNPVFGSNQSSSQESTL